MKKSKRRVRRSPRKRKSKTSNTLSMSDNYFFKYIDKLEKSGQMSLRQRVIEKELEAYFKTKKCTSGFCKI